MGKENEMVNSMQKMREEMEELRIENMIEKRVSDILSEELAKARRTIMILLEGADVCEKCRHSGFGDEKFCRVCGANNICFEIKEDDLP